MMNQTKDYEEDTWARDASILALYLVTAVVAMVGNLFVCVTIYRKKRLNSTTYVLIFTMAISDILGGFVIPAQWLFCSTVALDTGFFFELLCGIMKSLQILSYYVSSLTMAAIAFDRWRLVCRPMSARVNVKCLVIVVWGLGLLFISQNLFNLRVTEYFSPKGLITCRMAFQASNVPFILRRLRALSLIITQYLIPLGLTAVFYVLVMQRIWSREQMSGTTSQEKRQEFDEKKKQTIKMLIVVTVLFALSYLPTHVYHFLMFYTNVIPQKPGTCYSSTFYMLCYWLGISSCAVNVFVYCYFNAEFQNEARRYYRLVCNCGRAQTVEVEENSGLGASTSTDSTSASKHPEHEHNGKPQQLQLQTTSI